MLTAAKLLNYSVWQTISASFLIKCTACKGTAFSFSDDAVSFRMFFKFAILHNYKNKAWNCMPRPNVKVIGRPQVNRCGDNSPKHTHEDHYIISCLLRE